MTYIVQTTSGSSPQVMEYDIVDGANHASVNDHGALTLYTSRDANDVLAIYQSGQWASARQDGAVRRATSREIFETISVAEFGKSGT